MRYYPILTGVFVAVLMISQVTAVKPVAIGSVVFTGADLIFPLSYLLGDVLTEVYGFARSRVVIWIGLAANVLMSVTLFVIGLIPGEAAWLAEGGQEAWDMLLGMAPRIALASLMAYVVGEFLNSYVLARLKVTMRGKHLWMRTLFSSMLGQAVDTMLFFPIAYAGVWAWPLLLQIMITAYVLKVSVEVLLTPGKYFIVQALKRATGLDVYDYNTSFNPFHITLDWDETDQDS